MNILSKLMPFLNKPEESEDSLTPEEIAAQEKRERIAFHREKVRNGPVSFKYQTAGQQRRAVERAKQREAKKGYRREVKNYFDRRQVAAILRPHLQAVGLIPFIDGHEAPLGDQITSTAWIVQRYGTEVAVDGVGTGHVSFRHSDVLDALRSAARFYQVATGLVVNVPSDFEPAISIAEDATA